MFRSCIYDMVFLRILLQLHSLLPFPKRLVLHHLELKIMIM